MALVVAVIVAVTVAAAMEAVVETVAVVAIAAGDYACCRPPSPIMPAARGNGLSGFIASQHMGTNELCYCTQGPWWPKGKARRQGRGEVGSLHKARTPRSAGAR